MFSKDTDLELVGHLTKWSALCRDREHVFDETDRVVLDALLREAASHLLVIRMKTGGGK